MEHERRPKARVGVGRGSAGAILCAAADVECIDRNTATPSARFRAATIDDGKTRLRAFLVTAGGSASTIGAALVANEFTWAQKPVGRSISVVSCWYDATMAEKLPRAFLSPSHSSKFSVGVKERPVRVASPNCSRCAPVRGLPSPPQTEKMFYFRSGTKSQPAKTVWSQEKVPVSYLPGRRREEACSQLRRDGAGVAVSAATTAGCWRRSPCGLATTPAVAWNSGLQPTAY